MLLQLWPSCYPLYLLILTRIRIIMLSISSWHVFPGRYSVPGSFSFYGFRNHLFYLDAIFYIFDIKTILNYFIHCYRHGLYLTQIFFVPGFLLDLYWLSDIIWLHILLNLTIHILQKFGRYLLHILWMSMADHTIFVFGHTNFSFSLFIFFLLQLFSFILCD